MELRSSMFLKTASAAATRESVAVLMEDRLGVLAEAGVLTCGMAISARPPTSMSIGGLRSELHWVGVASPSPSGWSDFVVLEDDDDAHHALILDGGGSRGESMRLMSENRLSFFVSKLSVEALCRDSADLGLGESWPRFFF